MYTQNQLQNTTTQYSIHNEYTPYNEYKSTL